ncbi:MAG: glycosyltransferase, partial [Epsilonproteobacteria bacterium]|nr:glycosyltransferase [Campylobacterota bacterium]
MKIALFLYSLGPGGAERQASLLLKELARRYEVELVLVHDRIFYKLPPNVGVTLLDDAPLILPGWKKFAKLLPLAQKYAQFCKERSIDLSISFMNRPNYIAILSRLFDNRARLVVSERGSPSHYYQGLSGEVSKWLIKRLYPKADIVVANSAGNQEDLERNFGIENVSLIPNMFDIDHIRTLAQEPIPAQDRALFEGFTFITVGRLDRGKNQELLIRALHQAGLDAKLLIIGEGPLKSYLENLIHDLNMQDRVFLLGAKTNPFAYLARSDTFLFGSRNEGFPNVLVEALACDLPVISTDCPSGPAEILQDRYGILVPVDSLPQMAQAMERLYQDGNLRRKYSTIALERARDFSIEKV